MYIHIFIIICTYTCTCTYPYTSIYSSFNHIHIHSHIYPRISTYSYTDRPKEAEECYRQALSIKPDHVNANINMAHLCRLQKRWKEALSHYILASSKRPNDPVLYYYIGIMYQEIGDWKVSYNYYLN